MAGGNRGGGDGDYAAQAAELEARKQAARDALNLQFGIAPANRGQAPTREQFTRRTPVYDARDGLGAVGVNQRDMSGEGGIPQGIGVGSDMAGGGGVQELFDQAGFDAATAEFNNRASSADANRAAREALYSTVRDNAFNAGKRRIDESKDAARRNLRFELFAKGLDGGSVDVDQNALLGRTYDQGILDLGAKADSVRNDLRGGDENTRLGLLQSIDAGMDQGSAISSAINQQRINSDRAAAAATGTAVGDLFGGAGLIYNDSQVRKGRQTGLENFSKLFSTRPSAGAMRGSTGTVSSTGG